MKRMIIGLALSAILTLLVASPALAVTGRDFGQHHSAHAIENGGFTGGDNPGVMHRGFSGWTGV